MERVTIISYSPVGIMNKHIFTAVEIILTRNGTDAVVRLCDRNSAVTAVHGFSGVYRTTWQPSTEVDSGSIQVD